MNTDRIYYDIFKAAANSLQSIFSTSKGINKAMVISQFNTLFLPYLIKIFKDHYLDKFAYHQYNKRVVTALIKGIQSGINKYMHLYFPPPGTLMTKEILEQFIADLTSGIKYMIDTNLDDNNDGLPTMSMNEIELVSKDIKVLNKLDLKFKPKLYNFIYAKLLSLRNKMTTYDATLFISKLNKAITKETFMRIKYILRPIIERLSKIELQQLFDHFNKGLSSILHQYESLISDGNVITIQSRKDIEIYSQNVIADIMHMIVKELGLEVPAKTIE